jgi:hypothetical protein
MAMTQDNGDQAPRRPGAHPVGTAAAIIYGTFLLLLLTIPQSIVSWLGDMNANAVQQSVLRGAEAVQAASHRVGLDIPYIQARSAFFALTGKDDN